jgi:predicted  nucleic acid-binding Zn-ribbon protein
MAKETKPIQEKKVQQHTIPSQVTNQLEEIMRRLRLLEERYSGVRKRIQLTEQNMLKDSKDLFEEFSVLSETVSELKTELSDLNEKLLKLTEEVKESAKKTEVNVLAKYLDFWQPMNFLTKKDAEKLLNEYKKI